MKFAAVFAAFAMLFAMAQSASVSLNPIELNIDDGELGNIVKRQDDSECLAKIPLKARLELCVFGCDHCLDECTCK